MNHQIVEFDGAGRGPIMQALNRATRDGCPRVIVRTYGNLSEIYWDLIALQPEQDVLIREREPWLKNDLLNICHYYRDRCGAQAVVLGPTGAIDGVIISDARLIAADVYSVLANLSDPSYRPDGPLPNVDSQLSRERIPWRSDGVSLTIQLFHTG